MSERCADLVLYMASCTSNGMSYGVFHEDSDVTLSQGSSEVAIRKIRAALEIPDGAGIVIRPSIEGIAQNEADAKLLIAHAATSFPNIVDYLRPKVSTGNEIVFWRTIRFPDLGIKDKELILAHMKGSVYQPYTRKRWKTDGWEGCESCFDYMTNKMWERALHFTVTQD